MADDAQVSIKLVVDDQSSAVIKGVREETDKLAHSTHDVAKAAGGGGGGVAGAFGSLNAPVLVATAAVGLLAAGIQEAASFARELTSEAVKAADAEEMQIRAMAGVFTMIDRGGHSMSQLKNYAAGVHDELETAGLGMGVSSEKMDAAFNAIVQRGNMGTEAAKKLTEEMALVGKVVPQGLDGISQGFAQMEMGVVRARNPLVQLISSTGIMEGNAKQVAEALKKMSPDEQMAKAEMAIAKMSERIKSGGFGPEGLGSLATTFGGFKENMMESMGAPILDKLLPPLNQLKGFLLANADEINAFATKMGEGLGEVVEVGATFIGAVYDVISKNWTDIAAAGKAAAQPLLDAWHWIYDNKDTIASTFKSIAGDVRSAAQYLSEKAREAADFFKSIIAAMPGGSTLLAKAELGGAEKGAQKAATGMDEKAYAAAIADYQRVAAAAGESQEAINQFTNSMQAQHQYTTQAADALRAATDTANIQDFAAAYNSAIFNHQAGARDYAVSLITQSTELQNALIQGTLKVEGGFDAMIALIAEKAPELAATMKAAAGKSAAPTIKSGGASVHMSGGQTFNIKQDFRDQDPDRVLFVFRSDLAKHAMSRVQARTSTPFGL